MADPVKTIVIPGIAGSQLSLKGGSGGKTVVWYNPVKMVQYTPLAMALDTDGHSPYPVIGRTLFADGPVQLGVYEPLITQLANDGLTPRFWSYDWRIDLRQSAANLVEFLGNQADLADSFGVVAHSMGGLVAQLAYPLWRATTPTKVWHTTVYLGTPQGGAHWAAAELAGTYADGSELSLASAVYKLNGIPRPLRGLLFNALEEAFATTVCSWPSLYQCLPSNRGKWAGLDSNAASLLNPAIWTGYPGSRNEEWFTLAGIVQQQLVAGYLLPRPREVSYIGNGYSTLSRCIRTTDLSDLRTYANTNDGDGSVTVERATLGIGSVVDVDNTRHNALCYTGGPLALLKTSLTEEVPSNASTENVAQQPTLKTPVIPAPIVEQFPAQEFRNKTGDP